MRLDRRGIEARRRAAALAIACALGAVAPLASASRAAGPAPSASAVQSAAQQPARQQNDETASLRTGVVTAIDERGERVQVQGVWLAVADGKTVVLRAGKPAPIGSLKVGDTVRFTAAAGADGQPPVIGVLYAQ